ncbi:MAG: albusnodin/ikarugamycin family macrolactam cyclase [Pseudonocardia sp.]
MSATCRWLVGHHGDRPPAVHPEGGELLWSGPSPIWTVGSPGPFLVRVVEHRDHMLTAVGRCLPELAELQNALVKAVRQHTARPLDELRGSCLRVLAGPDGITLLADLAGQHPVFHTTAATGEWFATSPVPLAWLQHGRPCLAGIDRDALAAELLCPAVPVASTVLAGVRRGGHLLTLGRAPADVSPILPQPTSSFADGADALREALCDAVARRVRVLRRPTADLSGGLDSSSLVVLAARAGARPLAITYADRLAANDDDLRWAAHVAARTPQLRHVVVSGTGSSLPFTALDSAPLTDEPTLDLLLAARSRERLRPAVAAGSEGHLVGDGGDVVLADDLGYLGDLARRGHTQRLREETAAWARLRQRPARAVRRAAIRLGATTWPAALCTAAARVEHGGPVPRRLEDRLAWIGVSPIVEWSTDRARQAVAALLRRASVEAVEASDCDPAAMAMWGSVQRHGAATRQFGQVAAAFGVAVHAPFLDDTVVRACMSVPVADRTAADRMKPLLTAAVGDLLPAGLPERRTKGDYTTAEYHGLRANADQLRGPLRGPLLAELGVIEPKGPQQALDDALAGGRAPLGALGAVIATEVWLRRLDELPVVRWTAPARAEAAR